MNYFKIVILSFLLSMHCEIQSSTLGDLDDDFLDDILKAFIDADMYRYDYTVLGDDQYYQHLNNLDENDDMSQVSDDSYQNNAIEASVDNDSNDQQVGNSSMTPLQAAQQAYEDKYRELYRPYEPDDSENNIRAGEQAVMARKKSYNKVYDQFPRGKSAKRKREQSEAAKAAKRKREQSEAAKAAKRAAQRIYDQSEEGKAFKKAYRESEAAKAAQRKYQQSEKGKATIERARLKKIAQKNGEVTTADQINLIDQPQLVEDLNNNDDNLYQNENIDDHLQGISNMNDNIDNEIDNLLNGLDPYELF